jgi:hypothetical protein
MVTDQPENCVPLVETMNLVSKTSPRDIALCMDHDFVHGKLFKWNMVGVMPSGAGIDGCGRATVEFRRPPGSLSAEEAMGCVGVALAFVAGAVEVDGEQEG